MHSCLSKLFNSILSRALLKATRSDARQAVAIKTIFLGLKVAFNKMKRAGLDENVPLQSGLVDINVLRLFRYYRRINRLSRRLVLNLLAHRHSVKLTEFFTPHNSLQSFLKFILPRGSRHRPWLLKFFIISVSTKKSRFARKYMIRKKQI